MWTGWLGTPIHELSHVVMCKLFRHRVDEVALFEPDQASGRLGYVRHSWRKGNWFDELGNVFIGIAPLMGGSIVLALLLWLFFPDAVNAAFEPGTSINSDSPSIFSSAASVVGTVLQPSNFTEPKFWIFIYLVLCVGSHMAPSRSDYQGIGRGGIWAALGVMGILAIATVTISDPAEMQFSIVQLLSPVIALLTITAILCGLATAITTFAVSFFPKRYQVG